jgi:hypothetical protein
LRSVACDVQFALLVAPPVTEASAPAGSTSVPPAAANAMDKAAASVFTRGENASSDLRLTIMTQLPLFVLPTEAVEGSEANAE